MSFAADEYWGSDTIFWTVSEVIGTVVFVVDITLK